MKKVLAAGICLLAFTAGASASIIPQNITVDVNFNLDGFFEQEEKEDLRTSQNNTYGENVGGQSVYSEEKSNNPSEQRNTDDMKVTNDEVATAEDPIISFLKDLF